MIHSEKANKLIEKVAGAIELDMSAGQSTGGSTTSLEKTEVYSPVHEAQQQLQSSFLRRGAAGRVPVLRCVRAACQGQGQT